MLLCFRTGGMSRERHRARSARWTDIRTADERRGHNQRSARASDAARLGIGTLLGRNFLRDQEVRENDQKHDRTRANHHARRTARVLGTHEPRGDAKPPVRRRETHFLPAFRRACACPSVRRRAPETADAFSMSRLSHFSGNPSVGRSGSSIPPFSSRQNGRAVIFWLSGTARALHVRAQRARHTDFVKMICMRKLSRSKLSFSASRSGCVFAFLIIPLLSSR